MSRRSRRPSWLAELGLALLCWLVPWVYSGAMRVVGWTSRVTEVRPEHDLDRQGQPMVLMTLHQGLLYLIHHFRGRHGAAMASRSRDGNIVTSLLTHLGYDVCRGSDSRGGVAALREMIQFLGEGHRSAALTCDGPRGPYGEVKFGILKLAQASGLPLVPCAVWMEPSIKLRNWDSTLVPLPFSRIAVCYGEPVRVPAEASWEEMQQIRAQLEGVLAELVSEARRTVGGGEERAPALG